jgi:hypothetical protein
MMDSPASSDTVAVAQVSNVDAVHEELLCVWLRQACQDPRSRPETLKRLTAKYEARIDAACVAIAAAIADPPDPFGTQLPGDFAEAVYLGRSLADVWRTPLTAGLSGVIWSVFPMLDAEHRQKLAERLLAAASEGSASR